MALDDHGPDVEAMALGVEAGEEAQIGRGRSTGGQGVTRRPGRHVHDGHARRLRDAGRRGDGGRRVGVGRAGG